MDYVQPIAVHLDYFTDFIACRTAFYILGDDFIVVPPILLEEREGVSISTFCCEN